MDSESEWATDYRGRGDSPWSRRLRKADQTDHRGETASRFSPLDAAVQESARAGYQSEHARRYVATEGLDDGWDGPRPILLLYHSGRRSGHVRRTPILYVDCLGARYVIGSKGGAEEHPDWYLNLLAQPIVVLRVGGEVYSAQASTIRVSEHTAVWPIITARYPMHAEYARASSRAIPVVRLDRYEPNPTEVWWPDYR